MKLALGWRTACISGLAFATVLTAWSAGSFDQRIDRSWKRYRNSDFGYCVSYPARWQRGEAYDGAGIFVETGIKTNSRPSGEIDFEAMALPKDARALPINLVESLQDHLDGLQKFERAERMEILDKHEMRVQGNAALFTKHRYYDPQERATWMEEIVFVNRKDTVYRLELDCRADQIGRFAPVFEYLVGTLQFDCAN